MQNIITQYNSLQSRINKTLTSATGVGEALIPQHLEKNMTDLVIKLSPEMAIVMANAEQMPTKKHEFNRVTSEPDSGGAMGESAITNTTSSAVDRDFYQMKVIRRKGSVTGFLKATAKNYIEPVGWQIQRHIKAQVWDIVYYLIHGNDGNPYEFSGLDRFITKNRFNLTRGGEVPTNLDMLNTAITKFTRYGGQGHVATFDMSPELLAKFASLITTIRDNRDSSSFQLRQVLVNGGWQMEAFRGFPIVESTFVAPVEKLTSTVALDQEATDGTLSDGDYYIEVAPITLEGEQLAGDEVHIALTGGTATQRIKITLNEPHKSRKKVKVNGVETIKWVESAMAYRIYMSQISATSKLKKVVTAFLYDGDGTRLSRNNGIAGNDFYIDQLTNDKASVNDAMAEDLPLVGSVDAFNQAIDPPQILIFWDTDAIQGLGSIGYANDDGSHFEGLITTEPLAKIEDRDDFLVKTYMAMGDPFEDTSTMIRNIRAGQ
jgi:hypothetical protein